MPVSTMATSASTRSSTPLIFAIVLVFVKIRGRRRRGLAGDLDDFVGNHGEDARIGLERLALLRVESGAEAADRLAEGALGLDPLLAAHALDGGARVGPLVEEDDVAAGHVRAAVQIVAARCGRLVRGGSRLGGRGRFHGRWIAGFGLGSGDAPAARIRPARPGQELPRASGRLGLGGRFRRRSGGRLGLGGGRGRLGRGRFRGPDGRDGRQDHQGGKEKQADPATHQGLRSEWGDGGTRPVSGRRSSLASRRMPGNLGPGGPGQR